MFSVLFVFVVSRLVGEELPLFVALFGKLCMYYLALLQVSISRLVITTQLRRSVSSILSLSVGHLCFYFFLALRGIWTSVMIFSSLLFMQQFSFTPIFLLFLCYLKRDFLFPLFIAFFAHFSCSVCMSIDYV